MKRALPLSLLVLSLASGAALAQSRRPVPQGCKEDFGDCRENCTIEYGSSTRTYKQLTSCLAECDEKMSVCRERHYTARESGLAAGALDTPRESDPAVQETPRRSSSMAEDTSAAESDPAPAPESTGRRGVYRASEGASPTKKPVADESATEEDTSDEASAELPPPPPPRAETKPAAVSSPKPEAKPAVLKEKPAAPAPRPEPEEKPALAEKPSTMKEKPAAVAEPDPDDEATPPPPPPPSAMKPKPATSPERPPLPPEPKKDISEWDPDGD
jgi:hypothetical protein